MASRRLARRAAARDLLRERRARLTGVVIRYGDGLDAAFGRYDATHRIEDLDYAALNAYIDALDACKVQVVWPSQAGKRKYLGRVREALHRQAGEWR